MYFICEWMDVAANIWSMPRHVSARKAKPRLQPKPTWHQKKMRKTGITLAVLFVIGFATVFYFIAQWQNLPTR